MDRPIIVDKKVSPSLDESQDLMFSTGNVGNEETDNLFSSYDSQDRSERMSMRMSITTVKMEDDEEEMARKGIRGVLRKIFKRN